MEKGCGNFFYHRSRNIAMGAVVLREEMDNVGGSVGGMQDPGSMRPAGRIAEGPERPLPPFSSPPFLAPPPSLPVTFLPPLSQSLLVSRGCEPTACPVSTPTAGLETTQRQNDISGQPAFRRRRWPSRPRGLRTCLDSTLRE